MPSSGSDIQVIDGGPAYKHWATEITLEKILEALKKNGVDPRTLDGLSKSIEELNDNGKVDTNSLKQVLANLKQETQKSKERDKDAEEKTKKQEGFWNKSTSLGKDAARAFKDANIKEHLKGAGDMFIMPVESISDAFVKVAGVVGAFGQGLSNATMAVIDKLKIFGGKLGSVLKGAMGIVGWIAGGITTVIGGLLGTIEQLGDSFFDMYDTGINFSRGLSEGESGLGAMASAAANARLTVGEFAEFISENARVAVGIGAEAMGSLSNSVRTALYPLGNLGLTASETNEHLGEYLELQRTLGVLDTMSNAERARASTEYLTNLTQLTQITGKRRKQIAADMETAMKQTSLTAWMLTLNAEERKQAMKNVQAITGVLSTIDPDTASAFNEALGKGGMGLTDWGIAMGQAGYGQQVAQLDALRLQVQRGEIDEEDAKRRTLNIMREMRDNKAGAAALRELARTGDGAADTAVKLMEGLQSAELNFDKLNEALDPTTSALGSWDEMQRAVSQTWTNFIAGLFANDDFSKAMGDISTKLKEVFKPDGKLVKQLSGFAKEAGPQLVTALGDLGDAMPDIIMWMEELPDKLKSLWQAVTDGVTSLRSIFMTEKEDDAGNTTWVMKDFGTIIQEQIISKIDMIDVLKIGGAIVALFAAPALIGAVVKGVGGGLAGGLGKVLSGGGAKTPGVPKAPGATMGGALGKNIGGFVGGIGEGVLKGAAAGLAAFGGPQSVKIIAGAGTLGLAIAAIATGIAGAQWVLSKTMGPFAESLKGFEDLDGDALRKTGWGMAALGTGLGIMGGGSAIGAITNLIGAGFEAIGKVLGVDTMTRLKEFADAGKDLDIEAVRNASEGMALFAGAMAKAGGGVAVSGIGTLVSGVAAGLNSLMGVEGQDPISQMTRFGKTKIPLENISNNAKAMVMFSDAMKDAPATVGERQGGIFGLIASAFSGEVAMPWDQVKLFADAKLGSSKKLEENAKSMKLFSTAMSGFPTDIAPGPITQMFNAIFSAFGGKTVSPWAQVAEFSNTVINTEGVKKNAAALKMFAEALKGFPDIPMEKIGGMLSGFTSFFTGKDVYPWDILKIFGEAEIPLAAVTDNANALLKFSEAIASLPTEMVEKMEAVGKGIQAMSQSVRKGVASGGLGGGGSRLDKRTKNISANSQESTWVSTGEELETISVNAEMLTSATNREGLLGEIKVLLEDLNKITKEAKSENARGAKKLQGAILESSDYGPM